MPGFSELDQHLRTKQLEPIEPPRKHRARGRWDAEKGRWVYPERPPTKKQLGYLRALCRDRKVRYVRPKTRRAAQSAIDRLLR